MCVCVWEGGGGWIDDRLLFNGCRKVSKQNSRTRREVHGKLSHSFTKHLTA